jgi:hypothetical protein
LLICWKGKSERACPHLTGTKILFLVQVALSATCIVVCLDHRYRPTRILPEWRDKLMLGRSIDVLSNGNGVSHTKVEQKVAA